LAFLGELLDDFRMQVGALQQGQSEILGERGIGGGAEKIGGRIWAAVTASPGAARFRSEVRLSGLKVRFRCLRTFCRIIWR
jgi:hypothetical protein